MRVFPPPDVIDILVGMVVPWGTSVTRFLQYFISHPVLHSRKCVWIAFIDPRNSAWAWSCRLGACTLLVLSTAHGGDLLLDRQPVLCLSFAKLAWHVKKEVIVLMMLRAEQLGRNFIWQSTQRGKEAYFDDLVVAVFSRCGIVEDLVRNLYVDNR